jgi:hypothetical protein
LDGQPELGADAPGAQREREASGQSSKFPQPSTPPKPERRRPGPGPVDSEPETSPVSATHPLRGTIARARSVLTAGAGKRQREVRDGSVGVDVAGAGSSYAVDAFAFVSRIPQKESFMNDGPPAKRSDTQSPFAVLSPEVPGGQTATRVKITEAQTTEEGPGEPAVPAIQLETLKKPFASLSPKKPTVSQAPGPVIAAPPPPPSQLFAQTASMRPPGASSQPGRATAPKREGSAASRYGTCKEHGTALSSEGKCVLCARDRAKRDARRTSRVLVFLAVVLAGATAFAVLELLPK